MMNKNILFKEILKREKKIEDIQKRMDVLTEQKNKIQNELSDLKKIQKKLEDLESDTKKKASQLEQDLQSLLEKQETKAKERSEE